MAAGNGDEFERRLEKIDPVMETLLDVSDALKATASTPQQLSDALSSFSTLDPLIKQYVEQTIDFKTFIKQVVEYGYIPMEHYISGADDQAPLVAMVKEAGQQIQQQLFGINTREYREALAKIKQQPPQPAQAHETTPNLP